MRPSRNLNYVPASPGEIRSMFLTRRLSSFHPHSSLALCRASCAPPPCWLLRGSPPWPPRLPHPSPRPVFHPRYPGNHRGSCRLFHASADLMMERSGREPEPPYKRRKSEEEKRSKEGRGGGEVKDGNSRREHHPQLNHHFRDGRKNEAGKSFSRENRERTKSENIDGSGRDAALNQRWSKHPREGRREDSQPSGSGAQTHKAAPEQGGVPPHKHKPNAWFKERGAEEQGRCRRDVKAPEEEPKRRRSKSGGPWTELHPPGRKQEEATADKSLHRRWETTPACSTALQPPGSSTHFDFSVMSYNILSQQLLQDNAYLYRHCDPAVLPWDHRLPNLLAEIQLHDPDILCLQEVQVDHYENQIKPALQTQGYRCEYKKRTGGKPDGCAIVFKSSRLSLLSSRPVEYFRRGDALLDRDNVGLVVLLRPNDASDPSASICVANTHLLFNPRRGDVKLAQLAILMAEIGRVSRCADGSDRPVVLCGDFNSTPWSPLYSFLTTGHLDYRGMQIGMVSGQENNPRGQRVLTSPIWSPSLGINHQCQYETTPSPSSPSAVEGAISNLTVEDVTSKTSAAAVFNRERIEHGLKLQSTYHHRLVPDGRPAVTTCHSSTAMTVDYILFTPVVAPPPSRPGLRGLQLLGRLTLVGCSELEEINRLPNRHHSSDHLPLLARFRL